MWNVVNFKRGREKVGFFDIIMINLWNIYIYIYYNIDYQNKRTFWEDKRKLNTNT